MTHDTNKESKDHRDVTVTLSRLAEKWERQAQGDRRTVDGGTTRQPVVLLARIGVLESCAKQVRAALQPTSPQQEGS